MGLQGYYSTPDQAYAAAYMHINTVRVHKNEAYIFVAVYADKPARDAYQSPILTKEYMVEFSRLDNGLYANTYDFMKTQAPFVGWIDVIEADPPLAQVIPFPSPNASPTFNSDGVVVPPPPSPSPAGV
jgi:hypothetical protein